ncbi:unnamed protein product [Anisakis simplex]|uniref:Transmembrane protein n=1 Tax=Anisakis simplex TaxID=6269 RepID=A0A0M3JJ00_ANISI|nr:unnamed protein product [Anisakis simplex]
MGRFGQVLGILLVLATNFWVSAGIFQIGELRRMCTNMSDKWQLKLIEREKDTPREVIQYKITRILMELPEDVQDVYKKLLLAERARQDADFDVDMIVLKNRGASEHLLDAMEAIRNITLDMSLSLRDERKEIKMIKRSLNKEDQEILQKCSTEDIASH